jgi:hypothetical protein
LVILWRDVGADRRTQADAGRSAGNRDDLLLVDDRTLVGRKS